MNKKSILNAFGFVSAGLLLYGQQFSGVARAEDADITESQEVAADENFVAKFKDGTKIDKSEVTALLNSMPKSILKKISYEDGLMFASLSAIFNKLIVTQAEKSKLTDDPAVKFDIEDQQGLVAGSMLLSEKAEKKMDNMDALKKNYDDYFAAHIAGTKVYSATMISVLDKPLATTIAKQIKSETDIKGLEKKYGNKVHVLDIDERSIKAFPKETAKSLEKAKKGDVVGPDDMKGAYIVTFVKEIKDAEKKEFTKEFAKNYRKEAKRDFMDEYILDLAKKWEMSIKDLNGSSVKLEKLFKIGFEKDSKDIAKKITEGKVDFSKIKDDTALATFKNNEKITVKNVCDYFKIPSLKDQIFMTMAEQFKMSLADLALYAVKLVAEEKLLQFEVKETNYANDKKVKDRMKEAREMVLTKAYLKKNVTITNDDIKKEYKDFIKAIPEEDKNDNEIATKLLFFKTKEDASKFLKNVLNGDLKFNEEFKKNLKDNKAIDLGYVKKAQVDPKLWGILKRAPSATCAKEPLEIDSAPLIGSGEYKYSVVYVGDRRQVTLPSLENPNDKKYFEEQAMSKKMIENVKGLIKENLVEFNGMSVDDLMKDKTLELMLSFMMKVPT